MLGWALQGMAAFSAWKTEAREIRIKKGFGFYCLFVLKNAGVLLETECRVDQAGLRLTMCLRRILLSAPAKRTYPFPAKLKQRTSLCLLVSSELAMVDPNRHC